ncbi:MAG: peroxiredoxin [Candidatus Acidiferrales bacterium]
MNIQKIAAGRTVTYLLLTLAVLVVAYPMLRAADQQLPATGSAAPNFTLNSQEGTPVSLNDFRGKWVVLYFYPKDMTTGCTIEAHNFQRDLSQYEQKNAVILGVSADTVDSHKQFCTKDGLTFKLLADPTHEVTLKYGSLAPSGAVALRNTFLINPQGVIVKVYEKVDPQTHSEQLLADLADLQKDAPK